MSTGTKLKRFCGVGLLSVAVLCAGSATAGDTAQASGHNVQARSHKKTKKPPLPILPSGPTGQPVQQIPLDSIAAVAPQVSYTNNQLTIVAPNSTLGDILRAVRKQTGAEIEIPSAPDRVVTHLGPGPAREVIAELLNGSRFNYVLLGAPGNEAVLTRVVLVAKSGPENVSASQPAPDAQQAVAEGGAPPAAEQDASQDADAEPADDSGSDDGTDQQAAEAEQQQPQTPPEQPPVRTPQQMLQEMQQRQMQLQQQQQQNPGQPPVPPGVPRAPQEQ